MTEPNAINNSANNRLFSLDEIEKMANARRTAIHHLNPLLAKQLLDTMRELERVREKGNIDAQEAAHLQAENERLKRELDHAYDISVMQALSHKHCEHIFDTSMNEHTRRCCKCGERPTQNS